MLDRLVAYRFDMFSWLYKTGLQRCKRGLVAWLPGNARSECFQQQAKLAQGSLAQTDTITSPWVKLTSGTWRPSLAAPSPGLRIHSTRPQHSISMAKKILPAATTLDFSGDTHYSWRVRSRAYSIAHEFISCQK